MEYANDTADANKLRAIQAANQTELNIPSAAVDYNALNCTNSSPVDFLYLSTIRGGRKMNGGGCGCGMTSGGGSEVRSISSGEVRSISGGCFTCKKGVANITHIYSSIHIIIPTLYKKYKTAKPKSAKAAKAVKPKAAKAAKRKI
jgi:hypothetical protein